ncbi:MAG TPA: 3-phosphoshikimate 1-carboxyvinyltransferase [Candidatus Nanopelagicales bacterium]|nr:3-phosphoshikimate 1-carboxyvinyltransferase [Candidatus Nanopelagicales bacterium]
MPDVTPGSSIAVRPALRLRGEVLPPGDKSVSHRALLLALLAEGESRISGAGDGRDVRATAAVAAALGAIVERSGDDPRAVDYRVVSPGRAGLREPSGVLDCQNSGTTFRLTAGILAGLPGFAVLDGDGSLRARPMGRVTTPLAAMGAIIAGRAGATLPPLAITGRTPLRAIDHATAVPSAQVKSAVLLAGLAAEGTTRVREAVATRDHTERMLRARGVAVRTERLPDGGVVHALDGVARVRPLDEQVPGDISGAAFWLVAAAIHRDAELTIRNVGTNPTRRAIIDLLRRMGAEIDVRPVGAAGDEECGEPVADLVVRSSTLRGIDVTAAEVAAAIDEIPVFCLAAAVASGRTVIRGVGELRHKESDRVAGIAAGLAALGAGVTVDGDTIEIDGGRTLTGATVETHDDHRLAMTFAVAGLAVRGETLIRDPGSADVSYPGFFGELERVRA